MPDRHRERKSKYTVDRQKPGAFEGETVTRRNFMNLTAQGAGIVAVASFTLPALGFALAPGVHPSAVHVAADRSAVDVPRRAHTSAVITIDRRSGKRARRSPTCARATPRSTLSPRTSTTTTSRCPTGACTWVAPCATSPPPSASSARATAGSTTFGAYAVGGPPRDRSTASIPAYENGLIEIGPRYSVNFELQRFSPRDPGEPLNGIGQYLYPARFSTGGFSDHGTSPQDIDAEAQAAG